MITPVSTHKGLEGHRSRIIQWERRLGSAGVYQNLTDNFTGPRRAMLNLKFLFYRNLDIYLIVSFNNIEQEMNGIERLVGIFIYCTVNCMT